MEQQNTDPGARLTELRKKRGMTQKSLGTALNISEQAVSKWERGTTMPDIALLPAIAEILSTSIDYILTGKENVRYVTVSQYDMCRTDKRMGREKPLISETTMIRQFHKARKHPGNPIFSRRRRLKKARTVTSRWLLRSATASGTTRPTGRPKCGTTPDGSTARLTRRARTGYTSSASTAAGRRQQVHTETRGCAAGRLFGRARQI